MAAAPTGRRPTACKSPTRSCSRCAISRCRSGRRCSTTWGWAPRCSGTSSMRAPAAGLASPASGSGPGDQPPRPLRSRASACCRRPSPTSIAMPRPPAPWCAARGRTHLELVVRDDGRGFQRVDRVIAGAERGSNMGLLSIRERAALLGGVATVTSHPGAGSEVRVTVPARSSRRDRVGAASSLTCRIRLLLAEDHTLMRAGIRALLESLPEMEVVGEASTGLEAIALADQLQPDLVLLDISMPELNGLEVAGRLVKSDPRRRDGVSVDAHRRRLRAPGVPGRRRRLPGQGCGRAGTGARHPRGDARRVVPEPGRIEGRHRRSTAVSTPRI